MKSTSIYYIYAFLIASAPSYLKASTIDPLDEIRNALYEESQTRHESDTILLESVKTTHTDLQETKKRQEERNNEFFANDTLIGEAIGTLTQKQHENSTNIESAVVDIKNNTSDISKNSQKIGENEYNIIKNEFRINRSEKNIKNNRDNIAKNTMRIEKLELWQGNIDHRIDKMNDKLSSGIANAAAMTNIPTPYESGMFYIGGAIGGYESKSAFAIGTSYKSKNNIAVKASIAYNENVSSYGAGIAWGF